MVLKDDHVSLAFSSLDTALGRQVSREVREWNSRLLYCRVDKSLPFGLMDPLIFDSHFLEESHFESIQSTVCICCNVSLTNRKASD